MGDSFPVLGSPSSSEAETTHEGPGREGLAAAEDSSLKCSVVRSEASTGVLRREGRGDSRQMPRQTIVPLPFRCTEEEVPGGGGSVARSPPGAPVPPVPSLRPPRAPLATVAAAEAAAAAEAQLPPRPQKAPQTINPGWRRDRQRGRTVYPTRLLPGPATTPLKRRGTLWPRAKQALPKVGRSCSCRRGQRGPEVGGCRSRWPRGWVALARSPGLARSGVLRGAAAWCTGARIGRLGAAPGSRL